MVWNEIDYDHLFSLDYLSESGTIHNKVYKYFVNLLISLLDNPNNFENYHVNIRANILSFARFMQERWQQLRMSGISMTKIKSIFAPKFRELEMPGTIEKMYDQCLKWKISGTIDALLEDHTGRITILDYKTGWVSKKIQAADLTMRYPNARLLNGGYTQQGNFYAMLYVIYLGYKWEMIGGKMEIINDDFKIVTNEVLSTFDFGYLFTGQDGIKHGKNKYYNIRKKTSITSIRTIFKKMKVIRTSPREHFKRKPYPPTCKNCPIYLIDCINALPKEPTKTEVEDFYEGLL